jgi:hypothetical protein
VEPTSQFASLTFGAVEEEVRSRQSSCVDTGAHIIIPSVNMTGSAEESRMPRASSLWEKPILAPLQPSEPIYQVASQIPPATAALLYEYVLNDTIVDDISKNFSVPKPPCDSAGEPSEPAALTARPAPLQPLLKQSTSTSTSNPTRARMWASSSTNKIAPTTH